MTTPVDSSVDSIIVEIYRSDESELCDTLEIDTRKVKDWDHNLDMWINDEQRRSRLRKHRVYFVVDKSLLERFSSYFRALSRFREGQGNELNRVVLHLDVSYFFILLGFAYTGNLEVPLHKTAILLETCDFLGVDAVILHIETKMAAAIKTKNSRFIKEMLEYIPVLWNSSNQCGLLILKNTLAKFLAVHFISAVALSSFKDIPYGLLEACVNHPQLTVGSEKSLHDGLIKWFGDQESGQEAPEIRRGDLLNKVRASLIPQSVLCGQFATKTALDHKDQTIRMTKYSTSLDLSGCYEVDGDILFQSSARAALADGTLSESCTSNFNSSFYHPRRLLSTRQCTWPQVPTFTGLKMVNVSQCCKIPQDSLLMWLTEACPNLTQLVARNCPQIKLNVLGSLSLHFSYLRTVDISIDTILVNDNEILEIAVDVQSDYADIHPSITDFLPMRFLTCLSLRGRTELHDCALKDILMRCQEVHDLDVSMCTKLSDSGMSTAFNRLPRGLQSLKARHTNIGQHSCGVLGRTSRFQTLDLEGCHGLSNENIALILVMNPSLKNLCLADTKVDDTALLGFKGHKLKSLHLRDTNVSGHALHIVIKKNIRLTSLDVRGCTRVCNPHKESEIFGATNYNKGLCHPRHFEGIISKHYRLRAFLRKFKIGSKFNFFALEAMSPRLDLLKSLEVGVGENFCSRCLERIPILWPSLQKLRLDFKRIDVKAHKLRKILERLPCLEVLELHNTFNSLSAKCIVPLTIGCVSTLKVLILERYVTTMSDSELLELSRRFSNLSHFTLVGCKNLTSRSLVSISENMRVLIELRLEECEALTKSPKQRFLFKSCQRDAPEHEGLTVDGGTCLLKSCKTLERLILRHNGKGLEVDFVIRAMKELPYLWFLSLDACDSVTGAGFHGPNQVRFEGLLSTVVVSRCLTDSLISKGRPKRCHEETVITRLFPEWTHVGMLKRRFV